MWFLITFAFIVLLIYLIYRKENKALINSNIAKSSLQIPHKKLFQNSFNIIGRYAVLSENIVEIADYNNQKIGPNKNGTIWVSKNNVSFLIGNGKNKFKEDFKILEKKEALNKGNLGVILVVNADGSDHYITFIIEELNVKFIGLQITGSSIIKMWNVNKIE